MRIRVKDHVKFQADKMAKVSLATTARAQLDLYCVAPGQAQKPHTHADADKIYYVLEGHGRFRVGADEQTVEAGEAVVARAVAARTVALFRNADHIVVPSGSCAWMLRHEYAGLLTDGELAQDARRLAQRTYELSQFLVKVLGRREFRTTVGGRVTYHDSCHLLRGLHEAETPRDILRSLEGVEFVELPGADECCGFGGSFAVRLPEVSAQILAKKLTNVEATGATCLVAGDAGCLMQMSGGLRRRRSRVRALHLAELLDGGGG